MPIRVAPDEKEPTHLLSLTGFTEEGELVTIGFNPVDQKGQPSIHAIRYSGYPTSTPRVNTGQGEFSALKPPYGQFSRRDWSGGIGQLNGDVDTGRYWFGKRIWSVVPERMMLAPRLFFSYSPFPPRQGNWDDPYHPITFLTLPTGHRYAWKVSINDSATGIEVLLRTFTDNNFYLAIHTDNSGTIGNLVETRSITDVELGSSRYQFKGTLIAGTYWFVLYGLNEFEIATCDAQSYAVLYSNNGGSSWSTTDAKPPIFMLMSNTNAEDWVFFRYKWGTYAASGTHLLLNGDRGACDDNASDLYKLNDATKSWPTDAWKGAIVILNAAPLGWRRVMSNTANSLTVDRAWSQAQTTSNWYVILGANRWTEITVNPAFEAAVEDAKPVREEIVYFALGDSRQLKRMVERIENGNWVRRFVNENQSGELPGASFLVPVFDQIEGPVLYRVVNGAGFIAKAPAVSWSGDSGTDLTWGTEIKIGNDNFEDLSGGCEYDGKLAITAMDSVWFVKNGVAEKLSIDMESQWTMNTGRRPAVMPPYLVFPFGNRIQRFYNNLVENFGPERDGIPKRYDGLVMDCMSIVGGLIIVKDGGKPGEYPQDAEGGAFLYRNGAWHPLAFTGLGSSMKGCWYQRREDEMDYLWFGDRNGLWYMAISRAWDWTEDNRFSPANRIEPDGWFITGWFDTGRLLPQKWWDFISIFASNLSDKRKIKVYYQISNGEEYDDENLAAHWTYAGEASDGYTTHISLDVMGRRIRFLFLLIGDGSSTPILEGYSVNYLSRDEDAETWQIAFALKDCGFDRAGTPNEVVDSAELAKIINYWARTVRPLTMRVHFDLWDNREVIIERPGIVPLELTPEGRENHYAQMVIRGVEMPAIDPGSGADLCPLNASETGPYILTLDTTELSGDGTASIRLPYNAIIRTPNHTYRTRYRLYGTWYKYENGEWVETTDDDFYEVRAYDRHGRVVAVGVKDTVTDPNVRSGLLEALSPTRIASIGIHIVGHSLFRPQSAYSYDIPVHEAWDVISGYDFEWGYTEFGVWGRVTNWRNYRQTQAGWYYLGPFWDFGNEIGFGQDQQYLGQTFVVRHLATIESRSPAVMDRFKGYGSEDDPKWETQDGLNTVGPITFDETFTTTVVPYLSTPRKPAARIKGWATIPDYSYYDIRLSHIVWIHYPAMRKLILTGLEIENVC